MITFPSFCSYRDKTNGFKICCFFFKTKKRIIFGVDLTILGIPNARQADRVAVKVRWFAQHRHRSVSVAILVARCAFLRHSVVSFASKRHLLVSPDLDVKYFRFLFLLESNIFKIQFIVRNHVRSHMEHNHIYFQLLDQCKKRRIFIEFV